MRTTMKGTCRQFSENSKVLEFNVKTDLDILVTLIGDHDLNNEVLDVRRNSLLAHMLHEIGELHGQPFVALNFT